MTARISVIIPTYNYGRFISQAIQAALSQTLRPTEIIVVDDGSTDETSAVIEKFGEQVRYIRQENMGVCAARNRGVAESTGDFIAFLDADDWWDPTKLEKQLARFHADPELGLVHCGMREFDNHTGETIALHVDGQEGWVGDEMLLWDRPAILGPGCTIMLSRTAFKTVSGFDTRQTVGEDWDFCYRVARCFRVGFVPEALVHYRSHDAAAHRNVREMERGMGLFYEKVFAEGNDEVLRLKRRALGNYHRVLAGSYFRAKDYVAFARHGLQSVFMRPATLLYFLAFPIRQIKRGDK